MVSILITSLLLSYASAIVVPRQLQRTGFVPTIALPSDAAVADAKNVTRAPATPSLVTQNTTATVKHSTLALPTGPRTNLSTSDRPTATRPPPATRTGVVPHSIPAIPPRDPTVNATAATQPQCDVKEGVTCRLDGERQTILTAADLVRSAARADYQAQPLEGCDNPYPVEVEAKFFLNRLTYTLDDSNETDIDIHLAGWTMTMMQREGGSFNTDISLRISLCHIKPTSTILSNCACA